MAAGQLRGQVVERPTAGHDLGAVGTRLVHESSTRCFWALITGPSRVSGRAGSPRASIRNAAHLVDGIVVEGVVDQHAGVDGAPLAGMEADLRGVRHHGVQIGVVEHDHRGLAAQLEEHPFERFGALAGDQSGRRRWTR